MSEKMTIEETINRLQSMIQSKKFIEYNFDGVVDEDVCERAIELLKDQQPQSVVESSNMYTGLLITHCPKCGCALDRFLYGREYLGEIKHCPMCGKAVKWDE